MKSKRKKNMLAREKNCFSTEPITVRSARLGKRHRAGVADGETAQTYATPNKEPHAPGIGRNWRRAALKIRAMGVLCPLMALGPWSLMRSLWLHDITAF
ncbi:hypothetical protein RRG08_031086 [Elysia crispata]|uniref:Uncharacterized protein n=1 Tax=Elysia crispata TaxID=231223 RepID=A0AAE0ZF58_9GAST|nr:hypothetical protein RRG08_031086 [Elysia crispata]